MFLNAAIQGLNETRKVALTRSGMGGKTGFWGEKAPKFWKAVVLGLTTLALIAWYHSTSTRQNLEEYEAFTTYHKSAYLHFTGIPSFQGHLRIPVPFEVGFLFQKVPEMVFDAVAGLDTSDTDPVVRGVLPPTARHMLQTSFLLSGIPVPSAIGPILDHLRNRNFSGTEIVPYYMMRRPAPARHFRSVELRLRRGTARPVSASCQALLRSVWRQRRAKCDRSRGVAPLGRGRARSQGVPVGRVASHRHGGLLGGSLPLAQPLGRGLLRHRRSCRGHMLHGEEIRRSTSPSIRSRESVNSRPVRLETGCGQSPSTVRTYDPRTGFCESACVTK